MKKSDIKIIPAYGLHYANQASDENLMDQLEHGGISLFEKNSEMLEKIGTRVYAQGKWSVPIIIEHLIDAERVFQYRALRFARQDNTPLSGFDEDIWAAVSKANDRSLKDLLDEYRSVRHATFTLYKTFDKDQFFFSGSANGQESSVIALGFMMIGHAVHHYKVVEERYFGLIPQ
jgi:hypothetical protein